MSDYRTEREQRERRRRIIMRAVCIVIAVAMLAWSFPRCMRVFDAIIGVLP